MKRLIILLSILIAIPFSVYAQPVPEAKTDTIAFHFQPRSYAFLPEYKGNEDVVCQLKEYVDKHREKIEKGEFVIRVNTYTTPGETAGKREDYLLSYWRSLNMKTYLILSKGMKEDYFLTTNHVGTLKARKDVSLVSFTVNPEREVTKEPEPQAPPQPIVEPEQVIAEVKEVRVEEPKTEPSVAELPAKQPQTPEENLFLRTNLLEWATLTPNVGVEYRFTPQWSALLDLSWTHWNWKGGERLYRWWSIAPAVHYHFNEHWYAGLGYRGGVFGIKFSTDGKQGSYHALSLQGGYKLKLNKVLSLDFGIGVGYIGSSYEKIQQVDGCYVVTDPESSHSYFGPTQANVSLVWSISNLISKKK